MRRLLQHLLARPRMAAAASIGLAAGWIAVSRVHAVSASLIGWNVGVWIYLVLMAWLMLRADHHHLLRTARNQAQGAPVALALVVVSALASLVAIVVELAWLRGSHGAEPAWPHLMLVLATVLGGWLLLPVVFTLNYASRYFGHSPPSGLGFPDVEPGFQPHYSDFLYFAFTIAVAAQTSDVTVTRRDIRRLVLLQAVLSFGFNTAILAMAINIAAGIV